mmetsp:Transcript_28047/g.27734  ORF Transcript_28047/g.27734 Transcript_28047/m.27734 type:complete len:336 (+) Transcript_28047:78-1085(+)
MCTSAEVPLDAGQCVYYNNSQYSLSPCEDQRISYCNPQAHPENVSCTIPPQSPTVNIAYPGEPCQFDINCVQSICLKGICKGLPINSACTQDAQCDVGLFCFSSKCSPQIAIGQPGCTKDSQCVNNAGCNIDTGTCVAYLSFPPGTILSSCTNNYNPLCSSQACATVQGKNYCQAQVKSLNSLPAYCTDSSNCPAYFDIAIGAQVNTQCICGLNGFGDSFCSLAPGDEPYLNSTLWLTKWYTSKAINMCHTSMRTGKLCMQTYWDYDSYTAFQYFAAYSQNYPLYQFNDQCVRNIYTNAFWELEEQYMKSIQPTDNDDNSAVIAAIGGFLSLIAF